MLSVGSYLQTKTAPETLGAFKLLAGLRRGGKPAMQEGQRPGRIVPPAQRNRLVLADVDLDGLRLCLFLLGHGQRQNAVLVIRRNLVRIDAVGEREGTREGSVRTLDAM